MNKTKIEWCDYTINPVKGLCPMACSYCYARAMYKRFKWNEEIHYIPSWGSDLHTIKQPSRIFIGSTFELFGDWVKPEWMGFIFRIVKNFPEHTFIFLTKQPQNLLKFSPFPENVWLGVSATNSYMFINAIDWLSEVEAKVKFISFEPLLDWAMPPTKTMLSVLGWVIIGAQTPRSEKTFPKWAWVKEIIEAADKANIPVFLKPNLGLLKYSCEGSAPFYKRTFTEDTWELRQEFPAPSGVEE